MAWFGKRKRTETGCCECDAERVAQAAQNRAEGASVKVLGAGCAKCRALADAATAALETLGMDAAVEHVTDFSAIAAYGVMTTPALVVDGRVVACGKVLKADEIVRLLQRERG